MKWNNYVLINDWFRGTHSSSLHRTLMAMVPDTLTELKRHYLNVFNLRSSVRKDLDLRMSSSGSLSDIRLLYLLDSYSTQDTSVICRQPTAELTPWRKNQKVHHRTHNSPPPVPVLSQSNPIHTPEANLPKIHSDPIFPPTPWSSQWSLSL
jgi:hypothetical protein